MATMLTRFVLVNISQHMQISNCHLVCKYVVCQLYLYKKQTIQLKKREKIVDLWTTGNQKNESLSHDIRSRAESDFLKDTKFY